MKIKSIVMAGLFGASSLMSSAAFSATDIQWWHAMGGRLGEVVNEIAEKYNATVAENVSILYGGSVKPTNAKEIFSKVDVDGGLIGGAALKAEDFIAIIKSI